MRQHKTESLYSRFVTRVLIPAFLWMGILMILLGFLSVVGPKDPEYAPFFLIGGMTVAFWILGYLVHRDLSGRTRL